MGKVFENTSKRITIYSDNGEFKLVACRRAIMEEINGSVSYFGSKWYIETSRWQGYGYSPFRFSGLKYVFGKKKEIIETLSKSVQFTQAYAELTGR